jgi:hypothetical protein
MLIRFQRRLIGTVYGKRAGEFAWAMKIVGKRRTYTYRRGGSVNGEITMLLDNKLYFEHKFVIICNAKRQISSGTSRLLPRTFCNGKLS